MSTFTPPVVADRPPYNEDSSEIEKALFKFMTPLNSRYVSVFQLSDGTFVQDTPTTGHTNTNIPYPWNPSNPDAPYATAIYTDVSVYPPVYHVDETKHTLWVVRVFNGVTVVDSATAALLTTAGYGGNLT